MKDGKIIHTEAVVNVTEDDVKVSNEEDNVTDNVINISENSVSEKNTDIKRTEELTRVIDNNTTNEDPKRPARRQKAVPKSPAKAKVTKMMNNIDLKTEHKTKNNGLKTKSEQTNTNNPEEQKINSVHQFFYKVNMEAKKINRKLLRKELKKKQSDILGKMQTLEEEVTLEEEANVIVKPSERQTNKIQPNSESNAEFFLKLNMEGKRIRRKLKREERKRRRSDIAKQKVEKVSCVTGSPWMSRTL